MRLLDSFSPVSPVQCALGSHPTGVTQADAHVSIGAMHYIPSNETKPYRASSLEMLVIMNLCAACKFVWWLTTALCRNRSRPHHPNNTPRSAAPNVKSCYTAPAMHALSV